MTGAAISRQTLSDQVADAVVELIFEQRLAPGDVLPTEGALAERLGVSRIVVREAMRTLRAYRIVESGQGRPARVRVPDAGLLGLLLGYSMRQQELTFAELLDTRRTLEAQLAADAAAAGLTDDCAHAAHRTLATMAAAQDLEQLDAFIGADLAFHGLIAQASGNRLMALLLRGLEGLLVDARVATHRRRLAEGRSVGDVVEAHRRILDALVAGDPAAARTAMLAHLDQTEMDAPA